MTPLRSVLTLMLLVVCILLAVGCISQPAADTPHGNMPMNVTMFTATETPVETQCPVPVKTNCSVWATMNPIGDRHPGDIFNITGTI